MSELEQLLSACKAHARAVERARRAGDERARAVHLAREAGIPLSDVAQVLGCNRAAVPPLARRGAALAPVAPPGPGPAPEAADGPVGAADETRESTHGNSMRESTHETCVRLGCTALALPGRRLCMPHQLG